MLLIQVVALLSGVLCFGLRFGNRGTDSISYMSVGVPQGKIFIINPQSEITSETGVRIFHPDGVAKVAQKLAVGSADASASGSSAGATESSGYATMTDLVDHIFPFVETDILTEAGEQPNDFHACPPFPKCNSIPIASPGNLPSTAIQ